MDNENFILLDAPGDSVCKSENDVQRSFEKVPIQTDFQRTSSKDEEDINSEEVGHKIDVQYEDGHRLPETDLQKDLNNGDLDMEIEDLSGVPALIDSSGGFNNNGNHNVNHQPQQADYQSGIPADNDIKITSENLVHENNDASYEDSHCTREPNLERGLVDYLFLLQVDVELTKNVLVAEAPDTGVSPEIGCVAYQEESSIGIKKMGGSCILLSL